MNRTIFLYAIVAPFLVPLLPRDWRANKTLCEANLERESANQTLAQLGDPLPKSEENFSK